MDVSSRIGVILIDLQKAFTIGQWMQAIGPGDVTRISQVFSRSAHIVKHLSDDVPLLLTRCLFGREHDFEFDSEVSTSLEHKHYTEIIKPNTRILDFDPVGVKAWIQRIREENIKTVLIGGCTTTSCVRQSSIQLQQHFGQKGDLQVVVDLSMCGARDSNYLKRCAVCMEKYMGGYDVRCKGCEESGVILTSPVDKAVEDMTQAGVTVVEQFDWSRFLTEK
ncbi:uncharacterized protein LOC124122583 [Haliotis rufescens]|uniref:uncharacterized protein LOC124122583 n=1 Tax=Haliotis rufescens TaxID=6454 RepID=UPI001EB024F2|nr:uncharacterized protein LOC124122583 [Haliotis rufescens]XP_046341612.1 uncharacterized protein LOC124122583 [Haliotis rufescens]XP_048244416.1 uncharacterized protein LOC124122583 [Haliotis rufescens]